MRYTLLITFTENENSLGLPTISYSENWLKKKKRTVGLSGGVGPFQLNYSMQHIQKQYL